MTRDELNKYLCAVITTLDEVEYSPESTLYLGLGSSMDTWNTVKSVLINGNLATIENSTVRITPAGHAWKKIWTLFSMDAILTGYSVLMEGLLINPALHTAGCHLNTGHLDIPTNKAYY